MAEIIKADDLTDAEKKILKERHGWDGVSAVPMDLQGQLEKVDLSKNTRILSDSRVDDAIDEALSIDLFKQIHGHEPAVKKTAFEAVVAEAQQQVTEGEAYAQLNPAAAEAIKAANAVLNKFNNKDQPAQSDTPATPPAEAPKSLEERRKERVAEIVAILSKDDINAYARAVIMGTVYTKEFKILGGAITVTLREVSEKDRNMITTQTNHDKRNQVDYDPDTVSFDTIKYMSACSLVRITRKGDAKAMLDIPVKPDLEAAVGMYCPLINKSIDMPGYLKPGDTLVKWWKEVLSTEMLTSNLWRFVFGCSLQMNRHMDLLEELAMSPDFFGLATLDL